MRVAGSFHGTRTTGTVSVCEIACSIGQTSFMSVSPCCMSMTSASKPWRAMISAVNPWDTESQPIVTNRPSRQICLILFGRIVAPRVVCGRLTRRARRSVSRGWSLEPKILVGRDERMAGDGRHLRDSRADTGQHRLLHDRREHRALVHELLNLVEQRLASPPVCLDGLVAEEGVDVRIAAVGADAAGRVESSGTDLKTSRFTGGVVRQ